MFTRGSRENNNLKIFRIRELVSSSELHEEGRAMRHCVYTYANSCHLGSCSIWSVTEEAAKRKKRLATIEVSRKGDVRQVRGPCNCKPDENVNRLIKQWGEKEGLKVGSLS
ncbi:MAG: hypothetical protein GY765_07995 [bacterium]|nr:hypothetical protein [bacterium]